MFTGIIGEPGSGKTNFLTAMLYRAHKRGRKVVANYPLYFPHTRMDFKTLATLPDLVQDCIVAMDELAIGADAYDFWKHDARNLTTLVAEYRKRNVDLWYSVQYGTWITLRLRQSTGPRVIMYDLDRHITHCKHYNRECPGSPACNGYVCNGIYMCYMFNEHGDFVRRRPFNGRKYWTLYDTAFKI
jgi:hypothetical protein